MKMVWVLWLAFAFLLGVAVTARVMDHPAPAVSVLGGTCTTAPAVDAQIPVVPQVTVQEKLERIVGEKPKVSPGKLILGRVIGDPHCAWVRPTHFNNGTKEGWVSTKLPDGHPSCWMFTEQQALDCARETWGCK